MSGFIVVVPARAGSKGAPGKNIRPLGGIPLWRRAVGQGLEAGASRVIVTTDIREILDDTAPIGVTFHARPAELARDDTPMAPVLADCLSDSGLAGATVVLLQPTSPLRSASDIAAAVTLFGGGGFDLVMTVTETDRSVLKYGRLDGSRFLPLSDPAHCFSNRQALPPVVRPNGAVYVFGRDWFLENGGFVSDRIGCVTMPEERSFDIDTEADFLDAESRLVAP